MAEKLSKKVSLLLRLIFRENSTFRALIAQRDQGFLFDEGWFNSFVTQTPVDKNKKPIPWFTYASIDFLAERLKNDIDVLEFGSGNSTMWLAQRVKSITSIEHHQGWYELVKQRVPANANIVFVPAEPAKEYAGFGAKFGRTFDLIIIDAIERVPGLLASESLLTPRGVMILDDSERGEYAEAHQFMKEKGYRHIHFWGIAPQVLFKKCTTVFYRDGNCLDI